MPRPRQRFPYYAQALRLYPRAYYRKYGVQTLQTLADILDEPTRNRSSRAKLHAKAWFDLFSSIPEQRILASVKKFQRKPAAYIRIRSLVSLLLIAPLILLFSFPTIPAFSTDFWLNPFTLMVTGVILPIAATAISARMLLVWFMSRRSSKKKLTFTFKAWLAMTLVICLAGIGMLGFLGTTAYMAGRQDEQQTALSKAYQQAHPTLACTLLPESSVEAIMNPKRVFMDNDPSRSYSGVQDSGNDIQVTSCAYRTDNRTNIGVYTNVREALSESAEKKLESEFNEGISRMKLSTITVQGHSGYYMQSPQAFTLGLWVKGYWLETTALSFTTANSAMQVMITNLDEAIAVRATAKDAAKQRKIVPTPIIASSLTEQDKAEIGWGVTHMQMQPAGTQYDIQFVTIAGAQVKGTISYQNGIRGIFTAQKQNGNWRIVVFKSNQGSGSH